MYCLLLIIGDVQWFGNGWYYDVTRFRNFYFWKCGSPHIISMGSIYIWEINVLEGLHSPKSSGSWPQSVFASHEWLLDSRHLVNPWFGKGDGEWCPCVFSGLSLDTAKWFISDVNGEVPGNTQLMHGNLDDGDWVHHFGLWHSKDVKLRLTWFPWLV